MPDTVTKAFHLFLWLPHEDGIMTGVRKGGRGAQTQGTANAKPRSRKNVAYPGVGVGAGAGVAGTE